MDLISTWLRSLFSIHPHYHFGWQASKCWICKEGRWHWCVTICRCKCSGNGDCKGVHAVRFRHHRKKGKCNIPNKNQKPKKKKCQKWNFKIEFSYSPSHFRFHQEMSSRHFPRWDLKKTISPNTFKTVLTPN